jgi:ABC-type glycerol-3-phosphate transport system permease component
MQEKSKLPSDGLNAALGGGGKGTVSAIYLLLLVMAVASLGPFLWSISGSLMTDTEVSAYPPRLLPVQFQWANYSTVWTSVPFAAWVLNSTMVVVLSVIGSVISSLLVAYSFARFRFPGRNLLFLVMLSTLMLPAEVTLVPKYLLFRELRWLDTIKPLVIPELFATSAFTIFLLRQFFMTIPRDLDEAAYVDGASSWQILWYILVPLAKPAMATVAIIGFINHWNEFLQPLIFINTVEKYTLAVGIRFFQQNGIPGVLTTDHLLLTAAMMMSIPPIFLFFVAQKQFVQGIALTGIKG